MYQDRVYRGVACGDFRCLVCVTRCPCIRVYTCVFYGARVAYLKQGARMEYKVLWKTGIKKKMKNKKRKKRRGEKRRWHTTRLRKGGINKATRGQRRVIRVWTGRKGRAEDVSPLPTVIIPFQPGANPFLPHLRESLWLLFGPVLAAFYLSSHRTGLSPGRSRTVSESQQLKQKRTRSRGGCVDNALPFFHFPPSSPSFFLFSIFFAHPFIRLPMFGHRCAKMHSQADVHTSRVIQVTTSLVSWIGVQLNSRVERNYIFRTTLHLFNAFRHSMENISKFDYILKEYIYIYIF